MTQSIEKTVRNVVALGLSGLVLVGCLGGGGGSKSDPGGGGPNASGNNESNSILGNNRALLSGAVMGTGTETTSNLRKQIAVKVTGQNASFATGTAYVMRPITHGTNDAGYVVVPVTNTGDQTLCLVELTEITYRTASDTVILSGKRTYVSGSVAKLSSGIVTDTCLAPGEIGMAPDIELNIYAAVAKMEFSITSSGVAGAPSARVIPESYALVSSQLAPPPLKDLAITVVNRGSGPARVTSSTHKWFLLDDAEQPLLWGFGTNFVAGSIPMSGSGIISGSALPSLYNGSGKKLLVFVDFEDVPTTVSLRGMSEVPKPPVDACDSLSMDELLICRHESRNRRLQILKAFEHTGVPGG